MRLFLIRQLRPWHGNLRKRRVKRPKLYFRDAGLYHHLLLLGIGTMDELHRHPKIGASWEGFMIEKIAFEAEPDQLHFRATHNGAELDVLMMVRGKRIGVEIKRVDAPRRTPSMTIACRDLSLAALDVVYPGPRRYTISDRITAVPAHERYQLPATPAAPGPARG